MKLALHWQILIALVLAAIFGAFTTESSVVFGIPLVESYEFVGQMFLNALKMIVVPLIVSAIIIGIANIGAQGGFNRLGLKTIGFYVVTVTIAVIIGLVLVNLIKPGAGLDIPLEAKSDMTIMDKVADAGASDLVSIFLRMIPENIFVAAVEMEMLGLIFFSLLFGYFMMQIAEPMRSTMQNFWQGVYEVSLLITKFVMKFAPYGVFGLVAASIAKTGFDQFGNLVWFFVTVTLALGLQFFGTFWLMLRFAGKVKNPWLHYKAMFPALLTAFSTSSSAASLPISIANTSERVGVSSKITSLVLPLGSMVNMSGTALYECAAVLFIAQLYGVDLSLQQQFLVVLLALVTSIGVAGIPSASLVAISIILIAVGLPIEAIGLLMVFDRILDMMRTAVNVFSDSVGAVIIASSEGETGFYQGLEQEQIQPEEPVQYP